MRLNRTETKIVQAFLELCRQHDAETITVTQKCEHAHVARPTFYAYFENADFLIDFLESDFEYHVREILENFQYLDVGLMLGKPIPVYTKVYQYLLQNREISSVLFGPHGRKSFRDAWTVMVEESMDRLLRIRCTRQDTLDYAVAACAGVISGISDTWIAKGFDLTPEELSEICSRCVLDVMEVWNDHIS